MKILAWSIVGATAISIIALFAWLVVTEWPRSIWVIGVFGLACAFAWASIYLRENL